MIKINLLPAEKRKTERTPMRQFALIMTTAAVFAGVVLGLAGLWLKISSVEGEIAAKEARNVQLQQYVVQHAKLTADKAALVAKIKEITDVVNRDVQWWRAMSALWDVINSNPKVWIDDIRILDERSVQSELKRVDPDAKMSPAPPYGVSMRCHVGGMEVTEMSRFRTELKNHVGMQELLPGLNFNLDWKLEDEKDFDDKFSIGFSISLFGPPEKLVAKTAAPAAPKPGAPTSAPPNPPGTPSPAPPAKPGDAK